MQYLIKALNQINVIKMTSKDLLDAAKMKDKENYDRLIKHPNDDQEDDQKNV